MNLDDKKLMIIARSGPRVDERIKNIHVQKKNNNNNNRECTHRFGSINTRVVRVEAELVVPLLDPRVQGTSVFTEAHGKEKLLLGRVAQQESTFLLAFQ